MKSGIITVAAKPCSLAAGTAQSVNHPTSAAGDTVIGGSNIFTGTAGGCIMPVCKAEVSTDSGTTYTDVDATKVSIATTGTVTLAKPSYTPIAEH